MFGKLRKLSVLVLVFVLVASALTAVRAATISNEVWSNAITEPADMDGIDIIPGWNTTLNLTILASSGDPFTATTFPNADSVTVTAKFIDEYGNALDVTGDGTADVFSFTEDANTPGLWTVTFVVGNVTPGPYTLRIQAIAQNTTTGEIFDNVTIDRHVWIAGGPVWVLINDVKDGQNITIGALSFRISGLSDLGAILDFGNLNTQTITDDDRDGIFSIKVDAIGDGVADDWLTFVKGDDGYTLYLYSNSETLLDSITEDLGQIRVLGDRVKYKGKMLKHKDNYKAYIAWDESLLAKLGIKAVDYYIIPVRGRDNWKEKNQNDAYERVKIIKRTTYLGGLFGNEEVVFDGDIFKRNIQNIDGAIGIIGTFTGNLAVQNGWWEIEKALADITIPKGYTLKERELKNLAVSGEDWRGFNPVLKPEGRGLFKPAIDWASLLGFEAEESS